MSQPYLRRCAMQPQSGTAIGFEQYDQQTLPCPGPPLLCQVYRYSDANLDVVTGRPVRVGYLARPTTRFHKNGTDTTPNSVGAYLRVVGTSPSVVQGSYVDHIGATRGWRYGEVKATCVTNYLDPWLNTAIRCAYKIDVDVIGGDSGGPVFYYDFFGNATAIGISYRRDDDNAWFGKWNGVESEVTGAWPAPQWIRVVANDVVLTPVVAIVGPSEMQPGNSCYWYVSTNFPATAYEWRVNGVVVGSNVDLQYTAYTSFTLLVQATNLSTGNGTSKAITVSGNSSECFVQ